MTVEILTVLLLGLAAYRITRFFIIDSLIGTSMGPHGDDPASNFAVKVDRWAYDEETGEDRSFLRGKIGDLITCPWCLGFWISVIVYALWTWSLPWTVASPQHWILTTFAIAGIQGYTQSRMNA